MKDLFALCFLIAFSFVQSGPFPLNKNKASVYDYLPKETASIDPTFFDILEVPTAWASSQLCSAIFVSGIDEERAIKEEVDIAAPLVDLFVDYNQKSVVAKMKGSGENEVKSIYREGAGCTYIQGITEEQVRNQYLGDLKPLGKLNESVSWPLGDFVDFDNIPDGVDMKKLNQIIEEEFNLRLQRVRAVLIVYKGQIILERYDEGINKDSKLLGWSMTKSVAGALIGQLISQGNLKLDQKAPVEEWQNRGDERQNITIRNMLNMASGIEYFEGFVPLCLFNSEGNPAKWYAEKELEGSPGSLFRYSTGSTILLTRIAMRNRPRTDLTDSEYLRQSIYTKIQMHSSIMEVQATDMLPIGGSYMFATARDWARFGHLYMRKGVWVNGEQVLPPGWSDYSCELSPVLPNKDRYGAQWWITPEDNPTFACYMSGFRNQKVYNVVSKDLTIVRLAMPSIVNQLLWDKVEFLNKVLTAFE